MADEISPITAPPDSGEMSGRLSRVRALMAGEGLDLYVAAHTDNVYYLTNFAYLPFERPFFLVIPLEGQPVLIVPGLEVSHAKSRVLSDVEYHTYYEYPAPPGQDFVTALKQVIPTDKKVGIESSLSVALQSVMPGVLKVTDVIDEARLIKTDYEVGRIAYACRVVEDGLSKVFELAKPGAQEVAIYGEGVRQMMGRVILEVPNVNLMVSNFVCAVWPKALSAQPHSIPGLFDTLEAGGPHVTIITAQADGYSAELERTFFIGEVPEETKAPFETAMEARALAFELMKPGVSASELDEAVLSLIEKRGYGDYILHRTGHGFGITGHEPPWVAKGSKNVLQKNMVVSIEPGLYIPGIGGFRHSDTVLITDEGCMSMTHGPDTLQELTLPI